MALVFEDDVHFDPATDDAIIWGDEGKKRFRVVIPRNVLVVKYGLLKRFNHADAREIIQKHRADFERIAQGAHDAGKFEVIVG